MAKRITMGDQLETLRSEATQLTLQVAQLEASVTAKDNLIRHQNEELLALRPRAEQLEKVQKELASVTSSKDYYYKQDQEARKELEDLHTILDVVPGALPREDEKDTYRKYNTTLRLTVYFANQGKISGGVK